MVSLNKACCCLSLRTGNLILGSLNVVFGFLGILITSFSLVYLEDLDVSGDIDKKDVKISLIIQLCMAILSFLSGILLIYGSVEYKKECLIPTMILIVCQLVLLIVGTISGIVYGIIWQAVIGCLFILLYCYIILIPWSFYKQIKRGELPPRADT